MTVDYNEKAYIKERTIIKVSGILSGNRVRLKEVDEQVLPSPLFYTPDATGGVDIDVTDIVRIYGNGNSIELQVAEINSSGTVIGQVVDIDIPINGGTDPKNWIVPAHPYPVWKEWKIEISLPTKILPPIEDIPSIFGIIAASDVSATSIYQHSGGAISAGYNAISVVDGYPINLRTRGTLRFVQQVLEQECDKRYAAVQWIGRDGNTKRATWELRRVTENTAGEVEIENITNAYDVRKGSEITAILHLGGLTAYDVWYYGDIVTSSDVRLALDASDYDATNDTIVPEQKIAVTTKKIEIPDGDSGKFYDLDIEINYKRYDTV